MRWLRSTELVKHILECANEPWVELRFGHGLTLDVITKIRLGGSVHVPITPLVLQWAIDESGLGTDVLAKRVDVDKTELEAWLRGHT